MVKKDVCTSTETYEGLSNGKPSLVQHSKSDNDPGCEDSILHKRLDEKLSIYNRKNQRLDEKPDIPARRQHGPDDGHDPEINDEMDPRFRYESDYDRKPLRVFHFPR